MSKLEKILPFITLIGIVFKLFDVPMSGPLIVTSLSILSLLHYPLGFALLNNIRLRHIFNKSSYKGLSPLKLIVSFVAGIAFSSIGVGIMFKLMAWPGAGPMLMVGLSSLFIILAISLLMYFKSKEAFFLGILYRVVLIGVSSAVVLIANI